MLEQMYVGFYKSDDKTTHACLLFCVHIFVHLNTQRVTKTCSLFHGFCCYLV